MRQERASGRFGEVAGAGRVSLPGPCGAYGEHGTMSASLGKERCRVGGSSRRRSRSGLAQPDRDRQAVSILPAGGQRNVRRGGDGAHSSGWEPRSAPARARRRLTPKSCPTRAGRLKAANVRRPETHAGLTCPTEIRPGSAIGRKRMPARVVDRGSIRRRQRSRDRGRQSNRQLPTPRH